LVTMGSRANIVDGRRQRAVNAMGAAENFIFPFSLGDKSFSGVKVSNTAQR
jgi:hypothetical protein